MRKRWSLSVPMDGFALPELAEVAREAERLGYTDAWSFEVDGVDAFTPLTVIGLATQMRIGTAIANVYTRGPATLASTAAGLADVAPGRFVLGHRRGLAAHRGVVERRQVQPARHARARDRPVPAHGPGRRARGVQGRDVHR